MPEFPLSLRVVMAWVAAVNDRDVETAIRLSSPTVEIIGPKGIATGADVLRDWITRAGITLETRRTFVRGSEVVLEQQATWRGADVDAPASTASVSSSFRVQEGTVCRVARFHSLHEAFEDAGLTDVDEFAPAPMR